MTIHARFSVNTTTNLASTIITTYSVPDRYHFYMHPNYEH